MMSWQEKTWKIYFIGEYTLIDFLYSIVSPKYIRHGIFEIKFTPIIEFWRHKYIFVGVKFVKFKIAKDHPSSSEKLFKIR